MVSTPIEQDAATHQRTNEAKARGLPRDKKFGNCAILAEDIAYVVLPHVRSKVANIELDGHVAVKKIIMVDDRNVLLLIINIFYN